jgi:hypothetical protein
VEHVIQGDTRRQLIGQCLFTGGQGLQGDAHILVAGRLAPGQSARVAANIRKMRRQSGEKTHDPSVS